MMGRKLVLGLFIGMLSINSALADQKKETMWDVIVNDDRFRTFAVMVENAGVQHLFDGRTNMNATVYVPTDFAFQTMPQAMNSALRIKTNKKPLMQLIRSHYFIGTKGNVAEGEKFVTTNINGDPITIERATDLFVKDMVIQSEPIKVGRNTIVPIDCVMFVQPSKSDYRLTLEQQESSTITSCCLRTMKEVAAFIMNVAF